MTPSEEPKKLELQTQAVAPIPRVPLNEMLALVRDTELVATYGREIIESQLAINRFDQDWRLARVFAESGLFADAQAVNQAMTKVQLGRSWNMEAADAMQHIYFVNGKPAVQNEYLGAKMRDAGLDWDIEWHRDAAGLCTGVTLWPRRLMLEGWKPIMERAAGKDIPASVSFTKADADRVRVKEDGKWIPLSEKSTYKSFPDDMYFWRAIARLRRRYATNILSGVMTRDEADDIAPPQIEAPRERQTVAPTELTPGRQARRRAGAEDVVGTVKPEPATAGDGTKPEPPASETTVPDAETKPATPPAELPWKGGKPGMDQVLGALRIHVGPKSYMDAMASGGWVESDMKPEGGASVKFYERLRALPPEPAAPTASRAAPGIIDFIALALPPEPAAPTAPVAPLFTGEALPWVDQPSMIAAFRVQRELIGVLEFEKILNSKAGFTFGNSSWEDATALEIYRAMVAAPAAEKPKKLF